MGWTRQEVLEVARSTGRPVVEAWSNHNAGQMGTVVGPMLHHTGSAWSYPRYKAPTLRVVRDGRAGLENALSMYYIDYEGVIYCITEKIAWHAGAGAWAGITDGNGHFAGIEAESDGKQWTKATTASYKKLAAAILRKTRRTVAFAPRHADYALPHGRKTDFSGINPATFLADVNTELTDQEDDMPSAAEIAQAVWRDYPITGRDANGVLGEGVTSPEMLLAGMPHDILQAQIPNEHRRANGEPEATTSVAMQTSWVDAQVTQVLDRVAAVEAKIDALLAALNKG